MDWYELFKDLGIFGFIVGASTLIIRKFIEVSFSKDLERYKGELTKEAISFKTTFETLHTKRALVIQSVYKKLVTTQLAFESLMRPFQAAGEPTEEEKMKKAIDNFNELSELFHKNKIYFKKEIADQLGDLISAFKNIWHKFNKPDVHADGKISRDVNAWDEAWNKLNKEEIPPFLNKIEKEFRNILGIE